MQLSIDLGNNNESNNESMKKAKEAEEKKKAKNYEPTWEEVWTTGWTLHTGTFKKGIFQTKLSGKDGEKLKEVKNAVENGVMGTHVSNLKDFSKAHALNLYKELKEHRKRHIIKDMKDNIPDNYSMVTTEEGLKEVADMMAQEEIIALDTETTGVKWTDKTVGMSMSFPTYDKHVYIPYGHVTEVEQLSRGKVMKEVKPQLERKGLKLVLHNSKFDAHMLLKDDVNIKDNIYFDTMIAMHILNENEGSFALKNLANKYGKFFGYHDESMPFDELFSKDPQDFINADIKLATIYACKDTHLTLMLFNWQMEMMQKQPQLGDVYFNIEQKNTHVALEMENNGFEIDFDFAEQYKKELREQVTELEEKIRELWGDININSPKQLSKKFYDELGYKDVSGKRKVNADTLKKLTKEHPEVQYLLDYRDLSKLLSTYVEPLPEKVRKDFEDYKGEYIEGDYRLHGQFNQSATVTGRYGSKEPNLQNLPPRARKLIIAPKGKLLMGIDYSQIEPRTLASMSGDEGLQYPYKEGIDLYSSLASKIFNLPYENCLEADDETWREHGFLKHPRKMMKVGLLAVMYGITVPTLAENLGIATSDAQKFMDDFYASYPVMTEWMQKQVDHADRTGYTETMNRRKRRFIGHKEVASRYKELRKKVVNILGRPPKESIFKEELPYNLKKAYFQANKEYSRVERMAVNAVIQGSASEFLKIAMIHVYNHLKDKDGWRMLASVHDEILFEIPETATLEEIKEVEDIMINTVQLDVPIKVDTEIMTRWSDGIDLEEWVERGQGRQAFQEA